MPPESKSGADAHHGLDPLNYVRPLSMEHVSYRIVDAALQGAISATQRANRASLALGLGRVA
jgi:hypothetical protein